MTSSSWLFGGDIELLGSYSALQTQPFSMLSLGGSKGLLFMPAHTCLSCIPSGVLFVLPHDYVTRVWAENFEWKEFEKQQNTRVRDQSEKSVRKYSFHIMTTHEIGSPSGKLLFLASFPNYCLAYWLTYRLKTYYIQRFDDFFAWVGGDDNYEPQV